MFKRLLCCQSLFWLANEFLNKVLGFFGNIVPFFAIEVEFAPLDHFQYLLVVITVKWRVSAEQNVEDASGRPHVALDAVVTGQDFGRDVVRRSRSCVHSVQLFNVHFLVATRQIWSCTVDPSKNFRQAEVDDLQVGVCVIRLKQEVLGLEITVRNTLVMTIIQRLQNLFEQPGGNFLREKLLFDDPVE